MNALQIIYVVVVGWLCLSTAAWAGAKLTDMESDGLDPLTFRKALIYVPVVVGMFAAIVGAFVGIVSLLVWIGGQLG